MRVGLVHNHMSYAVKDPRAFSVRWVQPVIDWLDRVWGTAEVVRYFRTGRFTWRTPPLCGGNVEAADAPPGIDWVGLNYYGRCEPQGRETLLHVPCFALISSASFLALHRARSALPTELPASPLVRRPVMRCCCWAAERSGACSGGAVRMSRLLLAGRCMAARARVQVVHRLAV
jgi:hypothetical protein